MIPILKCEACFDGKKLYYIMTIIIIIIIIIIVVVACLFILYGFHVV
jgi:hypothetical protein